MEGVVVEVRVRAPCKRFVIKGQRHLRRSARGFDGTRQSFTAFFPLRTIRVVTRTSANLSRVPSGLPTNEWRVDSRVVINYLRNQPHRAQRSLSWYQGTCFGPCRSVRLFSVGRARCGGDERRLRHCCPDTFNFCAMFEANRDLEN